MGALDYESLWNKSRKFVRQGLAARDERRFDEFCFWLAVSLEILGKAMLARVHPALVADPQHVDSLFMACGKPVTTDARTIIAKTVFERISKLSKAFDQTHLHFCTVMATRRNADLHSGELPFEGLVPDTWASHFWRTAALMLQIHNMDLADWVGAAEAARAQDLLNAAATVLEQAIASRIEQYRNQFKAAHKSTAAVERVRAQAKGGRLVLPGEFGPYVGDKLQAENCPACGCSGMLSAENVGEDDGEILEDSFIMLVTIDYMALAFRCGVCNLKLTGQDELRLAGIELEFQVEEEREVEYDDPYLNE